MLSSCSVLAECSAVETEQRNRISDGWNGRRLRGPAETALGERRGVAGPLRQRPFQPSEIRFRCSVSTAEHSASTEHELSIVTLLLPHHNR